MKLLFPIGTALISLCAVSGVMIHGAHLDQIASVSAPTHWSQAAGPDGHLLPSASSNAHPHAEYQASGLFRYLERTSANSSPLERARDGRATLKSPTLRGRHAFDNTYLPLVG